MQVERFQQFHEDLRAALAAGVVLELDFGPRRDSGLNRRTSPTKLTSANLDQISNLARTRLFSDKLLCNDSGGDLGSLAIAHTDRLSVSGLPKQYLAALAVYQATDSMVPVLEGLSIRHRTEQRAARAIIWTLASLMLLLAVVIFGLWLFGSYLSQLVQVIRNDVTPTRTVDSFVMDEASGTGSRLPLALIVAYAGLVVWFCTGGYRKVVGWLGGRSVVRDRQMELVFETARLLESRGLTPQTAAELGCDLVAIDDAGKSQVMAVISDADSASTSQELPRYFSLSAARRLVRMRTLTSAGLFLVIGGLCALVYCLLIFDTVIAMLNDLGKRLT